MNRLSCLSPLPDQRRDSSSEDFFFNLPVPKQFADNGSRRSSGVPERIPELEENSVSLEKEHRPKSGNTLLVPEFKDFLKVEMPTAAAASEQRPPMKQFPAIAGPPQLTAEQEANMLIGDSINIIDTDQPVGIECRNGTDNYRRLTEHLSLFYSLCYSNGVFLVSDYRIIFFV